MREGFSRSLRRPAPPLGWRWRGPFGAKQPKGDVLVAIWINRVQRDAIHHHLCEDLQGIGDVYLMVKHGDHVRARELRRVFEDSMRLLDDLGWEDEDPRKRFELTRRVVSDVPTQQGRRLSGHKRGRVEAPARS
jgi:hypothetical protein